MARTRRNILAIVQDDERLSVMLNTLVKMSFIRRSAEDKKEVHFILENPSLRDYVKKRAPERLTTQEYAAVIKAANVLPTDAESPSVSSEVEKALQRVRQAAYPQNWNKGISELETARRVWGEDPRLLAQLGYDYFRMEKRDMARMLLEKAITAGLESAETYVHLALFCSMRTPMMQRWGMLSRQSRFAIIIQWQNRLPASVFWRRREGRDSHFAVM